MAGILDSIDNLLGTRLGLLVSDPRAAMQQMNQQAGAFNQASLLATQAERNAMRGRPVTQEQAAAKQYVDKVNEDLAMGFAGTVIKNPQPFKVAHGTNAQFDEFKQGMGVTAKHIYTTPEQYAEDAAKYGKNLITATASPKKMIDFSNYENLDKSTLNAIKTAAKNAGITDKYYTFNNFLDDLMSGQMYQIGGGQRTQNAFLDELFSKYDAVKMPDASVGGGVSQSVVFQNPSLLKIQK
jgi:predicted glycoside hydrolase/deacetylase ChbG (UPF0249 family)